ncbi:hypothetical protein PTKIN_Ptkin01aG0376800 [Pterospermum kingtungense]
MVGRLSTRLLNVCIASLCKAHKLEKAESVIIDGIRLGVLHDVVTYNTLIDAYCRFVGIEAGYSVLNRMGEAGITPDVVSYNSLIACATRNCQINWSLDLFDEMIQRGLTPDVWSYNTLMHSYFKLGKPDTANRIFWDIILAEHSPSAATFNIMMNGLCKNGYTENALMLFRNLQHQGFVPELVTYNFLVNGLCMIVIAALIKIGKDGKLEEGIELSDEAEKQGLCDKYMRTIIIVGLCKAGNIEGAARRLKYMNTIGFDSDLAAWNSLVDGLCKVGQIDNAMKVYKSMGVRDSFTYFSLVHNLYRDGRYRSAAKILPSCLRSGLKILKSAQRAVLLGLCYSGFPKEAKKLQSEDSYCSNAKLLIRFVLLEC